jgi:DNA-directed RNA polymerase specialized sigma24 family protein
LNDTALHRYLVKRVGPQNSEDLLGEAFVTAFRVRTKCDLSRTTAPNHEIS